MKLWILGATLLACCAAFCQQPEKPSFEVASIKPAEPMTMGMMRVGMNVDAGMLRYTNVALKDVIRTAYRVKDFQIEGPDWLGSARFDIVAKLPDGSNKDQVPEMLQALLAERFKLTLHRDSKDRPIYALIVGKDGPKLKPAEAPIATEAAPAAPAKIDIGKPDSARTMVAGKMPRGATMMIMDPSGMHLKASAATLAGVAEAISRFTERPVVDMTGIQGQYDFDLVFAPETVRGMRMTGPGAMPGAAVGGTAASAGAGEHTSTEPAERAGTVFEAVQRYGLKLDPRKAPMELLIIDHIEKTPTEN